MAQNVNLDVTETLNITSRRGDSFSITLTLKDSSGTALTLSTSNYEFWFRVKGKVSGVSSFVLGTPNVTGALQTFEAPTVDDSGNVTFKATAETMGSISSGRYTYDLQYKLPSSTSIDTYTSILKGTFVVNSNVSESVE